MKEDKILYTHSEFDSFKVLFKLKCRLQPIVDLASDNIIAYELLSKIEGHNEPNLFFSGLDAAMMLRIVTEQIKLVESLQNKNDLDKECRVYINLSPEIIASPEATKYICQKSECLLAFELDYSQMLKSSIHIPSSSIDIIKKHSHELWLDDFDADISFLGHLSTLWHGIKIDKSILWRYGMDLKSLSLIASERNHYSRGLIIEGIETEQQLSICKRAGFTYGQGFYWKDKKIQ
ncbi:EAL domain-containing protein [Aeromonas salmonicida]|uniref:EAL domain-containing protein n=1 Tax=Aeromonas salmonicida TaxID=645 RepID=UPI002240421A|nr:EAL domain-containing protein [Aeromonas salmonicida]